MPRRLHTERPPVLVASRTLPPSRQSSHPDTNPLKDRNSPRCVFLSTIIQFFFTDCGFGISTNTIWREFFVQIDSSEIVLVWGVCSVSRWRGTTRSRCMATWRRGTGTQRLCILESLPTRMSFAGVSSVRCMEFWVCRWCSPRWLRGWWLLLLQLLNSSFAVPGLFYLSHSYLSYVSLSSNPTPFHRFKTNPTLESLQIIIVFFLPSCCMNLEGLCVPCLESFQPHRLPADTWKWIS